MNAVSTSLYITAIQQKPCMMTSPNVADDDRFASICYWKENCACPAKESDGYDYIQCKCGLARFLGLVCQRCEAELVLRYNRKNTVFWACSDFSRTGCQFTRSIVESSFTQAARTPTKRTAGDNDDAPAAKRPRYVTPNPPTAAVDDDHDGTVRTTHLRPTCLFPTKTLHDTFIGKDFAKDVLVALQHSSELHFAQREDLNYKICCYWYTQQNNGNRPRPISEEPLTRKPVVLELFAGAGGMSLGFARAGFDVKFAVESNRVATDTLRSNHKDMIVFRQNVVDFLDEASQPNRNPLYPTKVGHIHASPPCQGFSEAKQICTLTPVDQQKNNLMKQFSRAVRQFRPTTASLENVKGVVKSPAKKRYLQEVVAELLKIEYQVRVVILNAQDYGVPQHRERLFLFAAKKGFPLPQLPIPLKSVFTVGMALGDLEMINPIQDGFPVVCYNGKDEPVYGHNITQLYYRANNMGDLQRDNTASTVCCRNSIRHYKYDRDITVRERARLQSFPDSYHFCGTLDQQCDQIGNAVPVKLAEAVGRRIMEVYYRA